MNHNPSLEQRYRTNVIIWLAMLVSQIMFLVVLFFVKRELFSFDFSQPVFGEIGVVVAVFAFLAVVNLALSFYMKSLNVRRAEEEQNPAHLQTATVLACAFCESISIIGLVLAFAFDYQYFFFWFALGIVGILLHFPKRDNYFAASYKKI